MDDLREAWRRFPGSPWPGAVADEDRSFLNWIGPLAAAAQHTLYDRVRASVPAARQLSLPHPLFSFPSARFLRMIKPMLVEELKAARLAGRLGGEGSGTEGFKRFTSSLREPAGALGLFEKYPVLTHELTAEFGRWVECRSEIATRLTADLPLLCDQLSVSAASLEDIDDIDFGAGDAHNSGRTVAIISFRNGSKVVYKPRSLSCDVAFEELLNWLNDRGLPHPLRAAKVLDCGAYGWSAHYEPAPCPDRQSVRRFYWRQGAFLAVFHMLRGYDMHFENAVAVSDDPVYFDLEALFYAKPSDPSWTDDPEDAVAQHIRDSVMAVGILPHRVIRTDEHGVRAMDMSALAGGAAPGEYWISPRTGYLHPGTDRMEPVLEFAPVQETGNRPVFEGRHPDPQDMADDLVAGFTHCYRLFLAHRIELLRADGPLGRFSDVSVRTVLRDTSQYRELLNGSWDPKLLRDLGRRQGHLSSIRMDAEHPAVENNELRQLASGDIPVFFTRPQSTDLRDASGLLQSDFFSRSGFDGARERIWSFSESDLQQQIWFIEASMATREEGGHSCRPGPPVAEIASEFDMNLAVSAASHIGDRICDSVIRDEGGLIEWNSLQISGDRYWFTGSSGMGLYRGVSGIALFLAELGRFTGSSRYRVLAQDIFAVLMDPDDMPDPEELAGLGIGGYDDLGGVLYLLARLGVIWKSPDILHSAQQLVPAFTAAMNRQISADIATGVSGAALSLMALHKVDPTPLTAEAIGVAGVKLADLAEMETGGFAYGQAGFAYALTAIAALTGEAGLLDKAAEARKRLAGVTLSSGTWCSGIAGLVMADASSQRILGGDDYQRHSELALVHEATAQGVDNDSLCHGTLGLVEALLTAAGQLEREELVHAAQHAAARVARRVIGGRVSTGVPRGTWTPGLLDGAAGVGYGLLRTAAPHQVPNVLLLSAP